MSRTLRQTVLVLGLFLVPAGAAGQEAPAKSKGQVQPEVRLESQMPAPAAPRPFAFPKPFSRTLPNGVEVFVIPRDLQPAISMNLLIPTAGAFFDPPGKPGMAAMTASLLTQGTNRRSAQKIAEAIDFVGGSISATAESDTTSVSVTVLKRDFALAMDLLSDVVVNPTFPAEELARKRQQVLSSLEIEYADAGYLAQTVAARTLYGLHPYGLPEDGTPDSVKAIQRRDVLDFHQQRYVPRGALLAISGDITPEEAFAVAEKYLGEWAGVAPEFTATEIPQPAQGLRFIVVDKPDAAQTQVRAAGIGVARNNRDYLSLYVANRIFGGGFNSRLNTRIRQEKGLTYGAYSQFLSRARAGSFVAGLSTKTESTAEATRLIVDLIGHMAPGEVTPQELAFAKDYLVGVFPMQSETPEQIAGRILSQALYGLPADYYQHYREKIQAVGAPQIKEVTPRYFDSASLLIVLVGNAGAFRESLAKAFPGSKFDEVRAADLDLLAADLRRKPPEGSTNAGVPAPTPESLDKGRALLLEAAKTAGGDALTAIKSLDLTAKGNLNQQGAGDVELHLRISYPDRMRLDMTAAIGVVTQGFDGATGWVQFPGGLQEVPPNGITEFRRSILLSGGVGIAAAVQSGQIQAQYLGEEEVAGKKTLATLWDGPSGPVRLYVDSSSHFLVAARFISSTPQGTADTLQVWDDFRLVEGVQYPFHNVVYQNGVVYSETFVQDVRLNQPLDLSLFVKPGN
jgi:zinc protease